MKYCPITWECIHDELTYSQAGLKKLSPQLTDLLPLTTSAKEQRQEAIARVGKMSIQGVQPKLSARLNVSQACFEIVSQHGQYILKPQSEWFPELPENEAITMSMAACIQLDVPIHGLIPASDGSWTYFIKRFDRSGRHHHKISVEDFAQLAGERRDSKYSSSMEKIAKLIHQYCTFPAVESLKFYKLTLFNYFIGNEDMHLKNFSILIDAHEVIKLSPAYDLLNTSIAQKNTKEELALPLKGKKNNLTFTDLTVYFPRDVLFLNEKVVKQVLGALTQALPTWISLINRSYLSDSMKHNYLALLTERAHRLKIKMPSSCAN